MNIEVSEKALDWFKDEVELQNGDKVQFFTQIYGTSPIREGYALAFTVDRDSSKAVVDTVSDGITFYVNDSDLWFFDGYDLHVQYDEKMEEVAYAYK